MQKRNISNEIIRFVLFRIILPEACYVPVLFLSIFLIGWDGRSCADLQATHGKFSDSHRLLHCRRDGKLIVVAAALPSTTMHLFETCSVLNRTLINDSHLLRLKVILNEKKRERNYIFENLGNPRKRIWKKNY